MDHIVETVIEVPVSLQEFLDRPDDSPWSEYADGMAIVSPSPDYDHATILANLLVLLRGLCPSDHVTFLAPFDWLLWDDPGAKVRQPDVIVIPRRPRGGPRFNRLLDPPLFAVEVISTWSRRRDLVVKPAEYARAGCHDFWVIDPTDPDDLVIHVFDGRSGEPVEVAVVHGDENLTIATPFEITLRPTDLLR